MVWSRQFDSLKNKAKLYQWLYCWHLKYEDVRQFSDIPFQIAGTHENNLQEIDHPKEFEQYIEFVFFLYSFAQSMSIESYPHPF